MPPQEELHAQWMNSYRGASIFSTGVNSLSATKCLKRHGRPSGDRAGRFFKLSFTWRSVAITANAATIWAQAVNSAKDWANWPDICHRAKVSIQLACIGKHLRRWNVWRTV